MRLDELMRDMGQLFEARRTRYFVLGATAMNFWVPPRNTVDLDVVLRVDRRKGARLLDQLKARSFRITSTLSRQFLEGRFIKIPIGDTELDLKLCVTRQEHEALKRAQTFEADDHRLQIATPEDIILSKLAVWRRQDQADIEKMVLQRGDLDVPYIEKWLGLMAEDTGYPMRKRWDEIRRG